MTEPEVEAFLARQRTVICGSNGRNGSPHLVPLWYVLRHTGPGNTTELWAWTFAKSQKARNVERDPRATLLVEDGLEYHKLRGVTLETVVAIHHDLASVRRVGIEIARRYQGHGSEQLPDIRRSVEAQAPKRIALQFVEQCRVSWDHRKLP